jgi:hypothetical protein
MVNKVIWKVIFRRMGGGVTHYAEEQRHDRAPRVGDVIDVMDPDGARIRATVRKIHYPPGNGRTVNVSYRVDAREN